MHNQMFLNPAAVLASRQNASLFLGMLAVSKSITQFLFICGEGGRTLTERLLRNCLLGPRDWTTTRERWYPCVWTSMSPLIVNPVSTRS
jgi:hypothetical protein